MLAPPAPDPSGNFIGPFPVTPSAFQTTRPGNAGDSFVIKLTNAGSCLSWSTLLGGTSEDLAEDLRVDAFGNVYVTGYTDSHTGQAIPFPTTPGVVEPVCSIYYQTNWAGFVSKLNPSATGTAQLVYSTFIGGVGQIYRPATRCFGIGLHSNPANPTQVYATVVGDLAPDDPAMFGPTNPYFFPAVNAIQSSVNFGNREGLIARLDPNGASYLYSTLYGGLGEESLRGCDVSTSGGIAACGWSGSDSTTGLLLPNAIQSISGCTGCTPTTTCRDALIIRLDPTKSGTATLLSGTLAGGCGMDEAQAVTLDSAGGMWVTGYTESTTGFPVTITSPLQGMRDTFILKVGRGGTKDFGRLLGGAGSDTGWGVAVDSGGFYLCGQTDSSNMFSSVAAAYPALTLVGISVLQTPVPAIQTNNPCSCGGSGCAYHGEPSLSCNSISDDAFALKLPFRP